MFLFASLVLAVVSLTKGEICGDNYTIVSSYLNCRTCDFNAISSNCVQVNREGCFCQTGYVLNRLNNACVLLKDCPGSLECPANEEISSCKSPCEKTCLHPTRECDVRRAEDNCGSGCVCRDGYVRDVTTGNCVEEDNCRPVRCEVNEEYTECGSNCERTCDLYNTVRCNPVCVAGCFCKEGYVKSGNGLCVLLEDCE